MIYEIYDVTISISSWDKVHFSIYLKPQLIKLPNLANW